MILVVLITFQKSWPFDYKLYLYSCCVIFWYLLRLFHHSWHSVESPVAKNISI
jgi:hypothetical protein